MHLTKLMSVLSIQYFLVPFFTKHRYNFIIQNKEQRYSQNHILFRPQDKHF